MSDQLTATFRHRKGTYSGWTNDVYTHAADIARAQRTLTELGQTRFGVVSSVSTDLVQEPPRPCYNLVELLDTVQQRLAFPHVKTLHIAEDLYRLGLISWPKTTSRPVGPNFVDATGPTLEWLRGCDADFDLWASEAAKIGRYSVKEILPVVPTGKHVGNADAEPWAVVADLSEDQSQVFRIIAKRYIAMFFQDRLVSRTTVFTRVDWLFFETVCRSEVDPGWSVVDPGWSVVDPCKSPPSDTAIPNITQNDVGTTVEVLSIDVSKCT